MSILNLPSEMIVEILKHCEVVDIINFTEAVLESKKDILEVISGKLLKHVVISPELKFLKYVGSHTKSLRLERKGIGRKWDLSKSFLRNLFKCKCRSLEKLTLVNCDINTEMIKFHMLPRKISHLKLENVTMSNRIEKERTTSSEQANKTFSSPFIKFQKYLPNSKYLEVEGDLHFLFDVVAASLNSQNVVCDIEGKKWTVNYEGVGFVATDTTEEGVLKEITLRMTLWYMWRREVAMKNLHYNWIF